MTHIHKEVPVAAHTLEAYKAPAATRICQSTSFVLVNANSPALAVMTDFSQTSVATTTAAATLAQANQTMVSRGVRLLLVCDDNDEVLGLITARDTLGERPIQLIQERGGRFNDLLVRDLMCPRERIDLIDLNDVSNSKVSDIVATLKHFKRQHLLVGETVGSDGQVQIRGVFSATQIGRQLGAAIQTFDVGSTFNEIEELLSPDTV